MAGIILSGTAGLLTGYISDRLLKKFPEEELRIDIPYNIIAVINAALYACIFYMHGISIKSVSYMLLSSIAVWVFIMDLHKLIIPDQAVIAGLIAGGAAYAAAIFKGEGYGWDPIIGMLIGPGFFLFTLAVSYLITKREEIGGGDIKIMAPIGLILGTKLTVLVIVVSVLLAGVVSTSLLVMKIKKRQDVIPFGTFIMTAVVIAVLYGRNIIDWYEG